MKSKARSVKIGELIRDISNVIDGGHIMKLLHRRQFLHLAAGTATLPALPHIARAQTYPSRPVRIIVGYPAGGSADLAARLVGQFLSERLGQQFLVENRPGAGGNIATEAVVRAPPDGYTLLLAATADAVNASLYPHLTFNFIRDIAAVALIVKGPAAMVVAPNFPTRTVQEFIALAKAKPGRVTMATAGNGSPGHLDGELFKMMSGVDLLNVSYRGDASALTDLMSGQVGVYFCPLSVSLEQIKAGRLRALAITSAARSGSLPDVPAMSEIIPGYEALGWIGLGAPRNISREIITLLNRSINAALPDIRLKYPQGAILEARTPQEFASFLSAEADKWAKVIKFAGVKPE
jgi:tripartite-type tricarboxylate transporter receptor subunit TctC